ncbi:hypothetical protein GCM10010304_80220 [Streptomyces roseoviolaceus]
MDTETWIAAAAAAISAVAAGIAYWQARLARSQARSAEDSAASARRQAVAAEEQVALMRQQLDGEEAARNESGGPAFEVISGRCANVMKAEITLKQTAGPALSSVTARPSGSGVVGIYREEINPAERNADGSLKSWTFRTYADPSVDLGPMTAGSAVAIDVFVDPTGEPARRISVRLECQARDNGRLWVRDVTHTFLEPPPEVPHRSRWTMARYRFRDITGL